MSSSVACGFMTISMARFPLPTPVGQGQFSSLIQRSSQSNAGLINTKDGAGEGILLTAPSHSAVGGAFPQRKPSKNKAPPAKTGAKEMERRSAMRYFSLFSARDLSN